MLDRTLTTLIYVTNPSIFWTEVDHKYRWIIHSSWLYNGKQPKEQKLARNGVSRLPKTTRDRRHQSAKWWKVIFFPLIFVRIHFIRGWLFPNICGALFHITVSAAHYFLLWAKTICRCVSWTKFDCDFRVVFVLYHRPIFLVKLRGFKFL